MKKALIVFLVFLLCSSVFAWQNTYRASSPEVKTLTILKNVSGVEFPSITYPVTANQMVEFLDLIDRQSLPLILQEEYDNLYSSLIHPEVLLKASEDMGLDADAEVLAIDAWKGGLSFYPNDICDVDVNLYFTPDFQGDFLFCAVPNRTKADTKGKIKYITLKNVPDLEQVWPTKAYASIGKDKFNLIIGRDLISAGNGLTGNLYLSENQVYNDFAKFSFMNSPLSYDFTLVVYDRFAGKNDTKLTTMDFSSPTKAAVIHRFSSTVKEKVTLSAYEGAVVYSSVSDIRLFNPFMLIHNWGSYINGSTNNFGGLEISAALGHGLSLDVQALIDQFKLPNELAISSDNSLGYSANLSGSWVLKNGILSAGAEVVYLDEATYLQEKVEPVYGKDYPFFYNDMIAGHFFFYGSGDNFTYMGYPMGGDVFAVNFKSEYQINRQTLHFDASYSVKGPRGIGVNEERTSDQNPQYNNDQTLIRLSLGADGTVFKGLEYDISLSFAEYKNYQHTTENKKGIEFRTAFKLDLSKTVLDRYKKEL